ncbi:hypothetical protein BLL42_27395 (plasmid) [Pseudomonas frederiksbergensis]|uniref:Shedu protein SduA C-terminal domain-containing protein n=1 Tax=Pseudomonas frederiksbergensis TaxID=104087 RepID=A0A1J0ETZ2_9PSED|nr:Shedu immune nuclease family protein [Pseudomonas frederiksbergensis]APC19462.1 hypothetical protein BLL42_27395 [Pseudomonas frederiksbergensis]
MASLRPSQLSYETRADGGPFLDFQFYTEDQFPTEHAEEAHSADVYFSDLAPSDNSSPDSWHRILTVNADTVRIWPIHQHAGSANYGLPKYGSITEIWLTRPVVSPYIIPTSEDTLNALLEALPEGFYQDWRSGLGLQWEYRFILESIASIHGVTALCIHGGNGRRDAKIDGVFYILGIERYQDIRQKLSRLTRRYQREARENKQLVCYGGLVHAADPTKYPAKAKKLPPDLLSELLNQGNRAVPLSAKDRQTATALVRHNAREISKSEPRVLLQLQAEIELVTLGDLIEQFKSLMATRHIEGKWQRFLGDNPFILNMAFAYPIKIICERPYVGNKSFNDKGGNYSDFLIAARSTGNLALIEIKRPDTDLLAGKPYRGGDTYAPSTELSGSVAQIIAQRASAQREIFQLKDGLEDEVHDHSISAIIIVGTTPAKKVERRSFEQYRNCLRDVRIVTFDELQQRLVDVHKALAAENQHAPRTYQEHLPF